MLHLFLVKSAITELVARGVMKQKGIAAEDAVFLAVRGYRVQHRDSKVVELPYGPGSEEPFPKIENKRAWNHLRTKPRLWRFDRFLARATGGRDFHYYSTNTRQRYNRVIARHPRCTGFSFLECGLISYRTRDEIEAIYPSAVEKKRDIRFYDARIGPRVYYDPGYEHVYGVGPLAFPGFERCVELAGVFDDEVLDTGSIDPAEIENVFVLDGLSAHGYISTESVVHATRRLFDHFRAQRIQRIHYKYHPAQIHAGEDVLLDREIERAAKDTEVVRLPESTGLEALAHARPEVHFFVNVSSTAIYAAQAGCRVTSYARYVAEAEEGFARTIDDLPLGWTQAVSFLDA